MFTYGRVLVKCRCSDDTCTTHKSAVVARQIQRQDAPFPIQRREVIPMLNRTRILRLLAVSSAVGAAVVLGGILGPP
jgi:hypothetical protein